MITTQKALQKTTQNQRDPLMITALIKTKNRMMYVGVLINQTAGFNDWRHINGTQHELIDQLNQTRKMINLDNN